MADARTNATPPEQKEAPPSRVRIPVLIVLAAAAGAALLYVRDPERWRSRWTRLRDRTTETVQPLSHRTAAGMHRVKQQVTRLRPTEADKPSDADLAQRVEMALFGDPAIPKGAINVNAEKGKVVLRGQLAQQEMIEALARKAQQVEGVREIENLLHLPGTPAPNKAEALQASQAARVSS